jgi:uncharacterized protein (DUF302 family)
MTPDDLVVKASPFGVAETVERLSAAITERGVEVFAVIDHAAAAHRHGLELRETQVVIFGSPVAGTPVMDAVPAAALDLPLKVLVWAGDAGAQVAYLRPDALAARYGIDAGLAAPLGAIDVVTDAAVDA